ncbi:MAG: hypothetical protein NVS2B16_18870 [Chloroflexota bacterium]
MVFRSLSLELQNRRPTPKPVVDVEILLMVRQEPDLPVLPWRRSEWEYVPTLLPAFEAEKAAAQQGDDAAWEFGWRVRHAFFAESRTICTRFELTKVAEEAGLDVDLFLREWDSGRPRAAVLADSERGWKDLSVRGSPTFILPGGKQVWNPAAARVTFGRGYSVKEYVPPDCPNGDCLQPFRNMVDEVIEG